MAQLKAVKQHKAVLLTISKNLRKIIILRTLIKLTYSQCFEITVTVVNRFNANIKEPKIEANCK